MLLYLKTSKEMKKKTRLNLFQWNQGTDDFAIKMVMFPNEFAKCYLYFKLELIF